VLRYFVSVAAGIAEMSLPRFVICSMIGTAAYATALASLGYSLASQWQKVEHDFSLAGYALAAVVIVVLVVGVLHRIRSLRESDKLR
jgi:membrane protein DedA with SNARE-associated domain